METSLCFTSALEYWHVARVADGPTEQANPVARRTPLDFAREHQAPLDKTPSSAETALLTRALGQFAPAQLSDGILDVDGLTRPLHVLVGPEGTRRKTNDRIPHRGQTPLPENSLVRVEDGLEVASPEFVYLQMAAQLDEVGLTWLASELCSVFTVHPMLGGGLLPARPLTDLKTMTLYLENAAQQNAYGAKKALRAVAHAVECAASRRELSCALRMSLPRAMGGRAIPKPQLNVPISLDRRLASVYGQRTISVDLCWPEQMVALEFDSDTYHLAGRRRAHDNDKRGILEEMGWRVTPLSSEQLDSLGLADNAFRRVAGYLGVKDRSKETRYDWQGRRSDLLRRLWQYEKVGVCNEL